MKLSLALDYYTGTVNLHPGYNYGAPSGYFTTEDYIYMFAFIKAGIVCKGYYLGEM